MSSLSPAVRIARAVEAADAASKAEATSDENLVELHAAINSAVRELRQVQDQIAERVAVGHFNGQHGGAVIGRRYAEVSRPSNRKGWKNDVLTHAVLAKGRDMAQAETSVSDPMTGEKIPTWEQAIEWIKIFWPLGGGTVRVTPLAAMVGDPDEFAEKTDGPWKLEVKGG